MKQTWAIPLLVVLAFGFLQAAEAGEEISSVSVVIMSPSNQTYRTGLLALNVTVYWNFASVEHMSYRLYGLESCELARRPSETEHFSPMHGAAIGIADLPKLAEGKHKITVHVEGNLNFPTRYYTKEATVSFTIDEIQLIISGLTVENKTYSQSSLPLNFTVNEATSWVGYSIDNEANVTLTGNTTLTAETGFHSLVLYANDTAGNMAKSDTTRFTITTPARSPSPSPTPSPSPSTTPAQTQTQEPTSTSNNVQSEDFAPTIIISSSAALGVLVYFNKKKK